MLGSYDLILMTLLAQTDRFFKVNQKQYPRRALLALYVNPNKSRRRQVRRLKSTFLWLASHRMHCSSSKCQCCPAMLVESRVEKTSAGALSLPPAKPCLCPTDKPTCAKKRIVPKLDCILSVRPPLLQVARPLKGHSQLVTSDRRQNRPSVNCSA